MLTGCAKCLLKTILFSGTAFFVTRVQGQEAYDFFRGVRQMGMGGAYTAVVNDETAVLSNPAGLGRLRDSTFTLIDPQVTGSFNDTNLVPITSAPHAGSMQNLLSDLNKHPGQPFQGGLQFFPSFVTQNFGIGLYGNYVVNAAVDKTGQNYTYRSLNDYAAALGYSFRFFGGVLKLGVTTRLVNRTLVDTTVPASSTGLNAGSLASGGLGVGSDVGLIVTAPVQLLPTFSVVVRDVGTTNYGLSKGFLASTSTRPPPTPQSIDFGLALFPILANHTRVSLTAEAHDILHMNSGAGTLSHLHVGGEYNFADFLFLRAGCNEGYWTAGLEFATERIQLQVASYGEETGVIGARLVDRRWMLKAAMRF